MRNQHPLYMDYRQIRHRIERRLSNGLGAMVHLGVYLIAVLGMLLWATSIYGAAYHITTFLDPSYGNFFAVWSALLLAHGGFAWARSARRDRANRQAVDEELRERLDADDTELLENPRRAFRIRGLLEADVRRRAGYFSPLIGYLALNAAMWSMWAYEGAKTPLMWQMTVPTALLIMVPGLVLNAARRRWRDRDIHMLLTGWAEGADSPKRKNTSEAVDERVLALSDDGELVECQRPHS